MSLDNRYAVLSSTEDAPGAQSQKRALAPRKAGCSKSKVSTSPATFDRDFNHAEKSPSVQHESAALPAQESLVRKPGATFPGANGSGLLMDVIEHVVPTGPISLQSESAFNHPGIGRASTVSQLPTAGPALSSASWFHKDQAGASTQNNHQVSKSPLCSLLGIPPKGESRISAAQPGDHRRSLDDYFFIQPLSVELSDNDITPAVSPPAHQKRGWPSPTNSPPAPTTRDRKSRFFPTTSIVSPKFSKLYSEAQVEPHHSCSVLYHSPELASSNLPTLAPSSTIKPRTKKSPPRPIITSYSPLPSPILIRRPLPRSSSFFNSNLEILPPRGDDTSSGINKKDEKTFSTASQHPGTMDYPQVQTSDLETASTAVCSAGQEQSGLRSGERAGGKEVEELDAWIDGYFQRFDLELKKDLEALEERVQEIEALTERLQKIEVSKAKGRMQAQDIEAWEGMERGFWKVS